MKKLLLITIIFSTLSNCVSLKPYEMQYVKDPDMRMSISSNKKFRNYVHLIREGSITSDGQKSSGGCGCN